MLQPMGRKLNIRSICLAIATMAILACGGGGGGTTHHALDKNIALTFFNNDNQTIAFTLSPPGSTISVGANLNSTGTWNVVLPQQTDTNTLIITAKTVGGQQLDQKTFTINFAQASANSGLSISFDGTNITFVLTQ